MRVWPQVCNYILSWRNPMRKPGRVAVRFAPAVALLAGSALLISSSKPAFSPHEKAYYANAAVVNFVRPGLVIKILSASIAGDGAIQARFRITDPRGLPPDRLGRYPPGAPPGRLPLRALPTV